MKIKSNQLLVRIRPQRIAILVGEHINNDQILSVLAFLSRIWDGRYSYIIVVKEENNGLSAKRSLSAIRPELVLGVGVDANEWAKISLELC